MSGTRFPHGISSQGVPIFGSGTPEIIVGEVFFVGSVAGGKSWAAGSDNTGMGTKELPFATLDYALSVATASNGDVIYLLPYHAETVTGAGAITLDKAGVKIIGLGHNTARPRFLLDGAGASGLVTAANVSIENCIFASGHADLAYAFYVTAKGCIIKNNQLDLNTTAENFVKMVSAGVADNDYDGLQIIGNVMENKGDAGELNTIILNKDSEGVRIIGNKIYGDYDTTTYAVIYSANTEHHMDIDISYNHIHNLHDANAVVGISVGSTTSTGFMHHNYVYALDVSGATPFLSAATGISLYENYYNHVGSTSSGYLHPAVGSLT
jgi:hypothetical protein